MSKSIVDFISDEDYPRYNELLDIARANKAATPIHREKKPMTPEQKKTATEKKIAKLQAELEAMLAGNAPADTEA